MRHTTLAITFLLVAGLAMGWALTDRTAAAAPNDSETASTQGEDTPSPVNIPPFPRVRTSETASTQGEDTPSPVNIPPFPRVRTSETASTQGEDTPSPVNIPPFPRVRTAALEDTPTPDGKDTEQTVKDYTYAQKAKFVADMNKALTKTKKELDRLSANVDKSSSAAKADAKAKLDAVRENWTQAKKQLDRAENATESSWDDVKNGYKLAYEEMKASFNNTRQWLSDKIAP